MEVTLTHDQLILLGEYFIEYKVRPRITQRMLAFNPFSKFPDSERLLREALQLRNLDELNNTYGQ